MVVGVVVVPRFDLHLDLDLGLDAGLRFLRLGRGREARARQHHGAGERGSAKSAAGSLLAQALITASSRRYESCRRLIVGESNLSQIALKKRRGRNAPFPFHIRVSEGDQNSIRRSR